MKIAVCCETEDAGGLVAKNFASAPFLLMIDVEKNVIYHVYGKQDPENLVFAEKIISENCEAVICGPLEQKAFERLAHAGISRFDGSGHKAQRAFIRFLRNQLPLIRDYIGGSGAVGHSHDLSCECDEESGGKTPAPVLRKEAEDHLFLVTAEEAAALPDELELPDGLGREEIEEILKSYTMKS